MEFFTRTYAKWILAGEHAVIRGAPALVFPLKEKFMDFHFCETGYSAQGEFQGSQGEDIRLVFWGVVEEACRKLKIPRGDLKGQYKISSNVPVGAGLGASALLCVTIARWFLWKKWIREDQVFEFARELENSFHGESSGVDIAGVLAGQGTFYEVHGERSLIEMNWTPYWFLSYSGQRAVTSDCVKKVKELYSRQQELERQIDGQMKKAVLKAKQALSCNETTGMSLLVEAIEEASDCFERWGLIDDNLRNHMQMLKSEGALAVKPTGSGSGGYVLSLWKQNPPSHLRKILIS